jgi:hypothetical protein
MRTTIRLPPDLLTAAKRHAAQTGRTLTALIEDALRLALGTEMPSPARVREALPTYGGDGVQPGVDLDDGAALLDLMDEER